MIKRTVLTLCLCLSLQGMILAQQSGLRNRETNPNYDQGDWKSYSVARFVTSIAVGDQYVYFGTQHSGITRFDQFQSRWKYPWTTSNGLADNEVWTVAFDFDTGFLWCATRTAISYYHPTSKVWRNSFKDEFGLPFSDRVESIGIGANKIFFETRGSRWFECSKFGGIILTMNTSFENPLQDKRVRWFGKRAQPRKELPHFFMDAGYLFNPGGYIEDPNFHRAEIVVTLEDDWGNLWLGTWGLGAGRGNVRALRLQMLDFGLANPSVRSLGFQGDMLWMGGVGTTDINRGITSWDSRANTWEYFEQRNITDLLSDQIYAITVDGDRVWFSTDYGLTFYDTRKGRWETLDQFDGLTDNVIYDVAANDSTVWIGSANGISFLEKRFLNEKDSLRIRPVSPGNLTIVEVRDLEMVENLLWAATHDGIYVYDTAKREGGFSAEVEGPISNRVNTVSRFENELWFGSDSGIDVYDFKSREWLGVPEGRFFPNKVVYRIVADRDAVWAATDDGVLKFNRESRSWRTFTVEDGLISNRVNAILPDGDHIWFGTDKGLTQFYWNDPSRID